MTIHLDGAPSPQADRARARSAQIASLRAGLAGKQAGALTAAEQSQLLQLLALLADVTAPDGTLERAP